jgi:branched-chain amino acid transport system ATP-binding protein
VSDAPLLVVQDLWKSFGGVHAVRGIGFDLFLGDVRAVIGPNGAGKTTLFNLVAGQLASDRGHILFRGEEIGNTAPHRIWRKGISRTFQVPATFRSLTVRENLQAALLSRQGRSRNLVARAAQLAGEPTVLLDQMGLRPHADLRCGTLSLSDLKRVELALALASEPSLLLLDEPTAGMATDEREALMALLTRIARERTLTVLFTEHDMDVVFGVATSILVMHHGQVLAEGSPAAVRANPEVQRVYLGDAL